MKQCSQYHLQYLVLEMQKYFMCTELNESGVSGLNKAYANKATYV